jgi:hypothetical protein
LVSKRRDSTYRSGRSPNRIKVKNRNQTSQRRLSTQYIESRKIEMSFDPDEDVTLNGAKMSLRSAVAKVMALSPDDRMGATIFRNGEPPILDRAEIEDIADLPGFQDHP